MKKQTFAVSKVSRLFTKNLRAWAAGLAMLLVLVTPHVARAESANYAAAFRWHGYMDTDLAFSEFFPQNHTVMAWFMPQYPNAYNGPILTNSAGTYFVGQGDYETDPDGAKLRVKISGSTAYYTFSSDVTGKWQHLAIRKLTLWGDTAFILYLNGVRKEKDGGGDLIITNPSTPSGTLRLGTSNSDPATSTTQFYGLVDDVAIFDDAITAS